MKNPISLPIFTISAYRSFRALLIITSVFIYTISFNWYNPSFYLFMLCCYSYCFSSVASLFAHFLIYIFSKGVILNEKEEIINPGIQPSVNIAFFRPIFAKTTQEMDILLNSMEKDIINNQEPSKNLKFILIDNTRDESVKAYARKRIRELEEKFGDEVVYYFHRNPKCDFFKKVGILEDAIMLLSYGWTKPRVYTSKKWDTWTKGTRNPNEPIFDEILGEPTAFGLEARAEDIIKGNDITVDEKKKIKIAFVCDADNYWPAGQIRKIVAKILHPDNKDIVIYQPSIEISNPEDNGYIKLTVLARLMYGFDSLVKWRLFRFSPFYGKGAIVVEPYIDGIILKEWLHPGKAASHDFQESLNAWTALVEDVYIMEKTFSNKISELIRNALWSWGDMETVKQFLFKKFRAGKKTHLFVLLRNVIGPMVFSLWLIGTTVSFLVKGLSELKNPGLLFSLFSIIIFISAVIPKFGVPFIYKYKAKTYAPPTLLPLDFLSIIKNGLIEFLFSVGIHGLDLVYKPIASVQNLIKQFLGVSYVWKTGAMGEIETADISLIKTYKILHLSTVIGVMLFLLAIFKVFPVILSIILSPFIFSFILGPCLIWATSKRVKYLNA